MHVCVIKMNETSETAAERKAYFVFGSGLIPVPHTRMSEVGRVKGEFHAQESKRAIMMAQARKLA